MYYIAINNKLTPVTAKTLRGAKIQATQRGADVVYETRESDRKDRYTGEDVNALIAVTRKGLHWVVTDKGHTARRISPDKWFDADAFIDFVPSAEFPV